MKLRVNAAELIAARDIIDTKDKTCSTIKVECQDSGYVITATNGFALVEFKSEHVFDDFDCGKCFFGVSSIKKFLKAADEFIDICSDGSDSAYLTAIDKTGSVRDSIAVNCAAESSFPTDDSVEKVFSSSDDAMSETVYINASYLCKIVKGIEKAYGKDIAASIRISGEHSPLAINASHADSYKLDATHKTFRSVLMPVNMRH